jgi:hypothetical protein
VRRQHEAAPLRARPRFSPTERVLKSGRFDRRSRQIPMRNARTSRLFFKDQEESAKGSGVDLQGRPPLSLESLHQVTRAPLAQPRQNLTPLTRVTNTQSLDGESATVPQFCQRASSDLQLLPALNKLRSRPARAGRTLGAAPRDGAAAQVARRSGSRRPVAGLRPRRRA